MNAKRDKGIGVLLTRPRHQAGPLQAAIEAAGGRVVKFPVMVIDARSDADLAAELATRPAADIVIFVSPNAVQHGRAAATGKCRIAAIGAATAAALKNAGIAADIVPAGGFDSESLLEEPGLQQVTNKRIRIVRGNGGRQLLGETLAERGAQVDYLTVYRRRQYKATSAQLAALEAAWRTAGIDYVIAMSVASLEFLLALLPTWCRQALPGSVLVTPSARVLKTAQDSIPGMRGLLSKSPDAGDLLAAMLADRQAQTDEMHE